MSTHTRSWSQLEQYQACPLQFQKVRLDKEWQRPAAWTAMGTAVHSAIEMWELSERTLPLENAQEIFSDAYRRDIDAELDRTPNTKFWESSGPYDGEADIIRRAGIGREHVARYFAWVEKHPGEKPWRLPDGRLAVELKFTLDLGGVKVRGVIDQLIVSPLFPSDPPQPRDVKTGAKPGKVKQLKTYGVAVGDFLEDLGTPRDVPRGDFFMTKTGKPTIPQNLLQITRDELVVDFQQLDANVNAGDFPANPGPACARCGVRTFCKYREG